MRILFSAVPAPGHLLPLLPLADAAAEAGHEVAFLTAADMAGYLEGRTLLPAGPGVDELLIEVERRTSGGDARHPGAAAVENFAGARIDLGYPEALDRAHGFAPNLLVCEEFDFVGPLVAAALELPWAAHAIAAPVPGELSAALQARARAQHTTRDLRPRHRVALVDPLPDVLRSPTDPPLPDDRLPMRPAVHTGGAVADLPSGPLVLVSAGTSVRDPDLLTGLAGSVADAGFEVVVTIEPGTLPRHPRVREIGFVPLAGLLPRVEAVVGTGGMGTVQATLSAGLPMVLQPVLADQPWNAQRVTAAGLGLAIDDPAEAGPAVRTVLAEPRYRTAAQAGAAATRSMPAPEVVLDDLLLRAGLSARS
ncbi:glycosyltransferase family 1 protein [Amycolatopsis rhizosphaerae]|uniref:Glycosyltransferase family 1 protein n=1 Tax=Amycolatopsis rhizosphaerae TaxID=2053003 RepID=A0A558DEN9_9PSEU|nr:nucleotide disphospho-sugar-binding domain-containing protein [Amycolatopsis rhizosphaerae]TVT59343.1 glycosyltransferase family 1 protein [Amycolatopsis rhizosphaerae]